MKYILILCFLMILQIANAVETTGKIETGYDPIQYQLNVFIDVEIPIHLGKVIIQPHFSNDIWLDTTVFTNLDENIISNEYRAGLKLILKGAYIGYEHRCYHPQNSIRLPDSNDTIILGVKW
jgi:hypothetical protein